MQALHTYFFSAYRLPQQSLWFKKFLYVFVFIESIYYLLYFDLLFGENSIVFVSPRFIGSFKSLAFLLYNANSPSLSILFLVGVACVSLICLFIKKIRLPGDILLWFLVLNVHNRIYPLLTGGDNLMHQFLIFNCFLSSFFSVRESVAGALKIGVHNVALLTLQIQVCLVYTLSALAKINDPVWLSGEAVHTIALVNHFSLFSFLKTSNYLLPALKVVNYFVLFYQLLFPVFVFIPRLKKTFLILGIFMHLYIILAMGLVGFGFIMIGAYLLFWPLKQEIQ